MTNAAGDFQSLEGHQYMNLVTYRKNGVAVGTPVWFAEADGRLYMLTLPNAGKIKRVRANPSVAVAACDGRGRLRGPEVVGMAQILPPERAGYVEGLLTRKYGLIKRLFDLYGRLTGSVQRRVYIEIVPVGERVGSSQ